MRLTPWRGSVEDLPCCHLTLGGAAPPGLAQEGLRPLPGESPASRRCRLSRPRASLLGGHQGPGCTPCGLPEPTPICPAGPSSSGGPKGPWSQGFLAGAILSQITYCPPPSHSQGHAAGFPAPSPLRASSTLVSCVLGTRVLWMWAGAGVGAPPTCTGHRPRREAEEGHRRPLTAGQQQDQRSRTLATATQPWQADSTLGETQLPPRWGSRGCSRARPQSAHPAKDSHGQQGCPGEPLAHGRASQGLCPGAVPVPPAEGTTHPAVPSRELRWVGGRAAPSSRATAGPSHPSGGEALPALSSVMPAGWPGGQEQS